MVKRAWFENGLDFEWDLKYKSSTIRNLDKWSTFYQKPFEIRTKMSRFGMVQPFENWNISNPIFKKFGLEMFLEFEWLDFRSPL